MLWLLVGGSVAVGLIVVVFRLSCVAYVFNECLFVGFPSERVDADVAELKPMRYCCTACVIIVIVVVGFVVVVVVART